MNEIGRELKASDLNPAMVVVVKPPGDNKPYFTVWVKSVTPKLVEFRAGELNWHIVNFIQPDGTIVDDQGRQVHVFEYLGEI